IDFPMFMLFRRPWGQWLQSSRALIGLPRFGHGTCPASFRPEPLRNPVATTPELLVRDKMRGASPSQVNADSEKFRAANAYQRRALSARI
ncbi:hypothetical protein, partial [Mesorhizobium sp. M3A.F.Ca.ET.174.01.1.1]|uniref:hypothetical protein n=1 Tax=Mesorhizobium sp. M3A.F.Ca.ET.174.01.1.1 TaxID=2563944 RepID=UPI001AEEEFC0